MSYDLSKLDRIIPYKWREQSTSQGGANMVAYIDARDVDAIFDAAVGKLNWQKREKPIEVSREVKKDPDNFKSKEVIRFDSKELFCEIGVFNPSINDWVWKSDVGTESNTEAEKGQASDAFKRAAVHWGVGAFLYRLGTLSLPTAKYVNAKGYEKWMVSTKKGDTKQILWDKAEINRFAHLVYQYGPIEGTKRFHKGEQPNFEFVEERHVNVDQDEVVTEKSSGQGSAQKQEKPKQAGPSVEEQVIQYFGKEELDRVSALITDKAKREAVFVKCVQGAQAVDLCLSLEGKDTEIESILKEAYGISGVVPEMGTVSGTNPFTKKSIAENQQVLDKLSALKG